MDKPYVISRSINGISLNGQEFALAPDGEVMTFASAFLALCHVGKLATGTIDPNVDLEAYGMNICKRDSDGNYMVC